MIAACTTLRCGIATDVGQVRAANEDRLWADADAGIFLVVDGVGGRAAGEVAADTAVESIRSYLRDHPAGAAEEDRIREAITAANNRIYALAAEREEYAGMACVLTLALVHDGYAVIIGHVGDSRLYLAWNGMLRKLTADHSPVGEREDLGELTEAEAMRHPRRHEVFRDVGSRPHAPCDEDFIDVRRIALKADAALLLSSDGLSDTLTAGEISAIIECFDGDAGQIARELVAAANEAGCADNVSAIFVAGPEFVGTQAAGDEARRRHGTTRVRAGSRSFALPLRWVAVGFVLGALAWAAGERIAARYVPGIGAVAPHEAIRK